MTLATLADFAAEDRTLYVSCLAPGCLELQKRHRKWGAHFTAAEAAARFGADLTLEEFRRRLRCELCGHRGRHILVEVSQPTPRMGAGAWD